MLFKYTIGIYFMKKTFFLKLLLLLFLLGTTIHSNPWYINSVTDWNDFVTNPAATPYDWVILDSNIIGTIANPVQTYQGTFRGHLDGNGFKIILAISSNDASVGLFSQLNSANIHIMVAMFRIAIMPNRWVFLVQ